MSVERHETSAIATHRRLLLRGEAPIAWIGACIGAILLIAMCASAAWSAHLQRNAVQAANVERVRALAGVLRDGSESMMGAGDLSPLRRLISETAQQHKFTRCRITLADGKILADAEPSAITADLASDQVGDRRVAAEASEVLSSGVVELRLPLQVAGRHYAELQVVASIAAPLVAAWESQAGVGVISAVALAGLLVVYRGVRNRMRAMGAIRESLLAIERGETTTEVLCVADVLGSEASAWNKIIALTHQLRQSTLADAARQSLGERRRVNSALDEAFDVMSQGLLLLDEGMRIKFANGAASVFMQTDRQKLIGLDARQAIHEPVVIEALKSFLAGGDARRRVNVETQSKDEADGAGGVLRWSIRPMRKDDSATAIIVIDDITQQRVAEEARHQFVAQATHELRTPLTNIRLYVETALDEGEQDAPLRSKCLNVINTETRRLERIVSDLLSSAEIEAGSLRITRDDVNLVELFEELHADYDAQAKDKRMALAFNLPPKLPTIQADRDKLSLALHNLIGNALKYTPAGGSVSINVDADEKRLMVDVVDTGLGISESDQERIFEKFYRAKDSRIAGITGSGLGLALARDVVRLHGGDITVQSQLDKGSTFTLLLPAQAA